MPDWKVELEKQLRGVRLAPVREAEIIEELAGHPEIQPKEVRLVVRIAVDDVFGRVAAIGQRKADGAGRSVTRSTTTRLTRLTVWWSAAAS